MAGNVWALLGEVGMEWLHLAGDIGASIAILVCLYFIWDLRKEVETLRDRISGGSLPELDTLEGGEEMPQVEGIASRGGSQVASENLPLGLKGPLKSGASADIAGVRELSVDELVEAFGAVLRKEREIYEAGADRRLDDLRSFLKREIRLTY